jgi:pSer/pThr/pTyr-binding forkhead associated (FHA) protein
MEATLLVVGGKASKKNIPLKLPMVVGRSRKAGLTIAHPMVSRQHCEVFEANGLLMVRDLKSLNGTMVGKQRIKEAPLPPDGELTVGPITFRAQYKYDGDIGALPAPVLAEQGDGAANDSSTKPIEAVKGAEKEASHDPFDDLLSDLS